MDRVYEIMNFLTGDNLFTHQLPRAFHACESWVKTQCPWLNELKESDCTKETWQAWLADAEARFGKEHELNPLPHGQWMQRDPIQEAVELMEDKKRVIVIQAP